MKTLITLTALFGAASLSAQDFKLPFKGRWFVMQGGDTVNVNQHMGVQPQWYGTDFIRTAGEGEREFIAGKGKVIADYYSWGQPVLSPVDGIVETVVDGFPDNHLGSRDRKNPAGNYVVIAIPGKHVFVAHFQKGSIIVKKGQIIKTGDEIAKCGNSGNSDFPHIHMHVQDVPEFNTGTGQNVIFKGINAELTGKVFSNVDWPMIRGLFVWN
jgi:murein DD-endopeptidase MepM/ murein hydrolase activator NlpD